MNDEPRAFVGLPSCLAKLMEQPRWVGWRWVERKGKRTKPPFQPSGQHAHNDDPQTWTTAAEIIGAARAQGFDGLGLQLLNLRGFAALDLDKVRDPATGAVLPWAEEAIRWGSYAEMTPSGTGFRVLGRVEPAAPPQHRKFPHPEGGEVEFYVNTATGRYITVTGDMVEGAPDALNPIDPLVTKLWGAVNPPAKGQGLDFNARAASPDFTNLPTWLQDYISHGRSGDRSCDFQSAVNALRARVDFDTALRFFQAHPQGPASKYQGRLERELRRSWNKAATSSHRFDASGNAPRTDEPARSSAFFSAATLEGKPVAERPWVVPDLVPDRTVTLFSGDGGTGKSLLGLQLGVAVATANHWLGMPVKQGPVIFFSAEDDEDELHRRLDDILREMGQTYRNLAGLTLRSLAGEDALLAIDSGLPLMQSELFNELEQRAADEAPALIVIDTVADVYPANENDRAKVRKFIGILRGLAIRQKCAVMLLAHPSLSGLSSGSGMSGSTAWNNSVRSRLYMERITDNGHEPDPDKRRLKTMKANYGPVGGEIGLTWSNGVFVPDAVPTGLDRMAASAKAERVFLKLLDEFTTQGRFVSASPGVSYAPTQFASHPKAEGMTKLALRGAMEGLLSRGVLVLGEHGKGVNARKHIARATGAGHAE